LRTVAQTLAERCACLARIRSHAIKALATLLAHVSRRFPWRGGPAYLAALRARLFLAVQPDQTLHDADLHHTDNGPAQVAVQFRGATLDHGDDAPGAIDATKPVWHDGHQAGEYR
jgi:hypothetical protein